MLKDIEEFKIFILDECKEDHIGIWYIVKNVHRVFMDKPADEIKNIMLKLIRDLLKGKLIVAGFPTKDGKNFEAWNYPIDKIVPRINAEWNTLGREPNIGEIVWFTSTDLNAEENG